MLKIIIEHHFAGIPKGRRSYRCFFLPLEVYIYTNLFQNYIDRLDYDSHIPTCTSVDPPLRKIIQQNFFLFQNLVDIPVSFLKGWNIPKNYFKNFHLQAENYFTGV